MKIILEIDHEADPSCATHKITIEDKTFNVVIDGARTTLKGLRFREGKNGNTVGGAIASQLYMLPQGIHRAYQLGGEDTWKSVSDRKMEEFEDCF